MRDLQSFFLRAPRVEFHGLAHRICISAYSGSACSMRGAWLHGARYNIGNYFGALYCSLELTTAQAEAARYFTVPPDCGLVAAALRIDLSRVIDLTGIRDANLIGPDYALCQELGLRAWETGIEALLVPSAAVPAARNLVLFPDNQAPGWGIKLSAVNRT